ncbi:MAG: uracil-DNA glycosylase family protein [Patescibacteria group bacterium]|nr:uracil-DNA glycosylase family protein [Patescibacteria group bacterium]
MKWDDLVNKYQQLQSTHGDKSLDAIISGGKRTAPQVCFIFMNPTGRNIASDKSWTSLKAPWIGTKSVWKLFSEVGIFDQELSKEIFHKKPCDWDYSFAEKVYREVENQDFYITNLAKCTQTDAKHLPNSVFNDYLDLLQEELKYVNPKRIICFGNQVSSIFIGKRISVSSDRRTITEVVIKDEKIRTMPTYYPVGQGQRNIGKAIADIKWFLKR